VALVFGCNAKVREFEVSPRHICPGERVDLTWEVSGSASLSMTPPVVGVIQGDVASKGRLSLQPLVSTRVELHAKRAFGSSTTSAKQIDVRTTEKKPEALAASVAGPGAGCAEGKVWATVRATHFAPTVRAAKLASHAGDRRSYEIEHAGVHAILTPGAVLTDFASTALVGDWVLTSPLAADEACGPSLPHNLSIDVFTSCVPGAGQ
jgi:hypothetical protein